ncbi:MAG TPA: hypothetical protein H9836_10410 [Candidatus Nocardiopsis merdipullorum]|nr:hypothetical protein [Candidatus Nocardiopsis merdipullorum]
MRQSHAAVLERYTVLSGEFTTEPYEVGWAGEARWFIRFLEATSPRTRITVRTQISPDGLTWCDWENEPRTLEAGEELVSWPVSEFGQWLRLKGTVEGDQETTKVMIYLICKS